MSQDNHRTSGRKSSEEDRHVLAALGVTAHAASSIESAFEAHAEHALSAHEARQLEARLGKVRTVIAGLEGRLSKTQSTATLDRLLSRLDDARGEERVILKSISGAGDQSDAKTRDLSEQLLETDAPRRPDVLPFLVGLPVKREAHPDAIERHVQKDVSPPDASASEDEEASDGESKESVEQIDDDGDEQVYQRRMHAWCLDSSVPEHFFESSLAEQCLQVRRAFQDIPHVCIAKDRFWITADLWNNDMLPYQRDGLQWLLSHYDRREGGILADEMGLGKTAQTITLLTSLFLSGKLDRPALVVAPTTVMRQWIRELRRWFAPLRAILLHSSGHIGRGPLTAARVRHLLRGVFTRGHVLVTSYGTLRAFADELRPHRWSVVILDEGHKIRNPEADITGVCRSLSAHSRFVLSGTPIQNTLVELWSLVDFVDENRLGSLSAFKAEFVLPIAAGGYANASHFQVQLAYKCACTLRDIIQPFLLRRVKADVAQQLPPKEEHILFCQLTAEQRQLYRQCLASDDIQAIIDGERNVLAGIDLLRKVCNHPLLVCRADPASLTIDEHCSKSGKLAVVQALLRLWREQGHRGLLFCQTRQMLDIVEAFVRKLGVAYLRMDGLTPIDRRAQLIEQFNGTARCAVFLLTTKVGGLGVNLTGADRVLIVDPDWNPSTDLQARERVWRLGQSRPVSIYRLVTAGTIEEKIYHRQIFKTFLTNRILKDPKQARFFKAADLYDLFTLADDDALAGGDGATTETADMFGGLEDEIMLRLSGRQKRTRLERDTNAETAPELVPDDHTHILDTLFHAVDGLHSALRHDFVVERSMRESVLVEREAAQLAQEAAEALRRSASHASSQPSDDAGLSQRLFRTLRANGNSLTSDELVQHFGREVDVRQDAHIFRALLRSIATLRSGRWHLKPELCDL